VLLDKPFAARIVSTSKQTQRIVVRAQRLAGSVKSAKLGHAFRFAKRERLFVRVCV